MAPGLAADVRRGLDSTREALLLERAERVARGYDAATRVRVARFEAAARVRERAARDIANERSLGVVAALLLEALALRASALAAARGQHGAETGLGAPAAADVLDAVTGSELAAPPSDLALALALLRDPDPLRVDRLSLTERDASVAALERALGWVRTGYEPRATLELRRLRWFRLVGSAVLVVLVGVALVVFWSRPANVGHGKAVRASSRASGSAPVSALLDGVRGTSAGFRTSREAMPWVELDLLREHELDEIVVYPSGTSAERAFLPLTIEIARERNVWHELAVAERSFSELSPWRVRADGERARYVRILGASGRVLALSEVEVYGEPR